MLISTDRILKMRSVSLYCRSDCDLAYLRVIRSVDVETRD